MRNNSPYANGGYNAENLNDGLNREYFDAEAQNTEEDFKYSRAIRHAFIRKVLGILSTQLLLTTAVGTFFTLNEAAQKWSLQNPWFVIGSCIISFVVLLILICAPGATQNVPTNYILLFTFTFFEALTVGILCGIVAVTQQGIILQAFCATAVITVGLFIFSFQTKCDFTSYIGYLFYILIAACVFGIFVTFFGNSVMRSIKFAIFALLMCAYIVVDIQLMIGKGKYQHSEDDYIICALSLYVDIVRLFLYLLQLLMKDR